MISGSDKQAAGIKRQDKRRGYGRWIVRALGLSGIVLGALHWLKLSDPTTDSTDAPQSNPSQGPARKGHETSDANARWIFGIVGFLLVFGLAIHFILAGLLSSLNRTPPPSDRWRPTERGPRPAGTAAAAFPRLQVDAAAELEAFRAREETELTTYGWINKTSGIVRVPIDRAIDLVLQQGLPVRNQRNETQTGPSTYQLLQQRPEHREPEIKGEQ